jgi:CxxC-x17-CxxC domain-containing protein
MAYQDKTITCSDCGVTFTFSAGEQESFASRGYTNEPKRCTNCRQARKAQTGGGSSGGYGGGSYNSAPRQMTTVTCSECGKEAQVPFQPRGDRPVYCSECYNKNKPARKY